MGSLLQDLRFAVRSLAKHPGFAAVIVLTLALGIGADTAIFSIVNATLLRPLPYGDSERLVVVEARRGADGLGVSWLDYLDWKERSRSFDDLAYFQEARIHLGLPGGAEAAGAVMTTGNLFSMLRVPPALGRGFLPEETLPGAAKVAVISHELWTGRFGGDRQVLGRTVRIEGESHAIIGVMPRGFHFPSNADLWVCVEPLEREYRNPRTVRGMEVVGRLKPGVTLEAASADLRAVAAGLGRQYPDSNAGVEILPVPLRDRWVGDVRTSLLLLLGACGFLLLIACANVANLLLARAVARQREISVRTALGAGRLRLVRQLLTESLVLAGLGGAAGLVFASWGTEALLRLLISASPAQLPAWIRVETDSTVLAFAAGISLVVGLLFGLAPILPATRVDLISSLKEGSRGTDGTGSRHVRNLLVVSEVALALLLLLGAGLTMNSLVRLWNVHPGFSADGVLTVTARFPFYGTDDVNRRAALFRQAQERLGSLPGVAAIGANTDLPLTGTEAWHRTDFLLPGQSPEEAQLNPKANLQRVTPGYFQAMGIPLLRGSELAGTSADTSIDEKAPRLVLINRAFAERLSSGKSSGKDPVGQRIAFGSDSSRRKEWTVAGVVGDVRHQGLDRDGGLDIYVPFFQFPSAEALTFVLRGEASAMPAISSLVRTEIRAVSSDLLVESAEPLERLVASALWRPRLWGALFGAFSAVALLLAAVGIYGVMSFTVGQRTREIGLRMALGAGRATVARLLLGQGLRLTLAGIAAGLTGGAIVAVLLGRFLTGLLYQVKPMDLPTWLGISLLLAAVALLATWIPTRRAMRIDPMVALRRE